MFAVEKSPVEVTLPPALQSIRPWPLNRAVDQSDHAFGQASQLLRLEVRAEGEARHVEIGVAGAGR